MRERGILFKGPMVRVLLDGTKTQTRRIIKWPEWANPKHRERQVCNLREHGGIALYENARPIKRMTCPYGVPGDRLWVRETWQPCEECAAGIYRADLPPCRACSNCDGSIGKWTPSIFMPRCFSRIDLEVLSVRVERVQDITEGDAKAEGVRKCISQDGKHLLKISGSRPIRTWTFKEHFAELWDSINAKRGYSWESNPWVWAITFRRIKP